jgi:hypothetical protein
MVASGEVKDVASTYPEDSCLNDTFNGDDEIPIGETNDHDLLEDFEKMVLRASKGLSEMQGKDWRDLVLNQEHLEGKTLSRWSWEGHTTEGSFETRCSYAQGKSQTVCTQALGFHEKADQLS